MQKNRKYKEYAVYKGDKYITDGKIKEIAKKLNVKPTTINFYLTPTYKKRNHGNNHIVLVKIK